MLNSIATKNYKECDQWTKTCPQNWRSETGSFLGFKSRGCSINQGGMKEVARRRRKFFWRVPPVEVHFIVRGPPCGGTTSHLFK